MIKNNDIFISIIIPAYNVDQYIERCILSCLKQDIPQANYEIIIIDDGSLDNTLAIIKKYEAMEPNVFCFSQQNSGLSIARNEGVKKARGEYLWFVDSDDWIEPDVLGTLYKECEENQLDILWMKWKKINSLRVEIEEKQQLIRQKEDTSIYSGKEFLNTIFRCLTYAWSFCFKRSFWIENNFSFYPHIMYEDLELIPKVINQARKIKYIPLVTYNYYQREGSIINSFNQKKVDDYIFVCSRIAELKKREPENPYFPRLLSFCIISLLKFAANPKYQNREKEIFEMINENRIVTLSDYSKTAIDRIFVQMFNQSPLFLFRSLRIVRYFTK